MHPAINAQTPQPINFYSLSQHKQFSLKNNQIYTLFLHSSILKRLKSVQIFFKNRKIPNTAVS